jgi:hypothetical protein
MPTFRIVELCLTYRCNLMCYNCSNLCSQAPIEGDLTMCNIEQFISDIKSSTTVNITLHGGEPSLHPGIGFLLKKLKELNIPLWLLSNNANEHITKLITTLHDQFNIPLGISTKKEKDQWYVPINESPFDLDEDYTLGCFQTRDCGICYNYLGWFPCSPIAAAARVFGYKGCKTLNELTENKIQEYFINHCKHCGFAFTNQRQRVNKQAMTKTWINALEQYNRKKGI